MAAETQVLYRDLAYVFLAAVAGGIAARILRQPMILGYVLGGIFIGPFTPGPTVSDLHALELLAEIGVILLMYSIESSFLRVNCLTSSGWPLSVGPWGFFCASHSESELVT